ALTLAAALASLSLLVSASISSPIASGMLDSIGSYLTRDQEDVGSLSGRTVIFEVLLRSVPERPLGIGFSAGPRELILSNARELRPRGVIAERIGNAHSAYLEVLVGSGWL